MAKPIVNPVNTPGPRAWTYPPANDITPGPICFHTPDDIARNADAALRAGIIRHHLDNAPPAIGERLNVVVMEPHGHPHLHRGMIRPATCKAALPGGRILVDFVFHNSTPGTKSAWVDLTQCSFPDRIDRGDV
ncbi:hypothetical protein [Thalassospira povalilytica]|uniref:hypothetical protein n=1 Tax=Thalassospira povalilytica TaxID=732237 RepID=UPI003AA89BBD